jgi:hypothetical protein
MHLHGHERFDMNNDELLGIIWEHRKKKKKARGEFFLVWKGIILVELIIICTLDQISTNLCFKNWYYLPFVKQVNSNDINTEALVCGVFCKIYCMVLSY